MTKDEALRLLNLPTGAAGAQIDAVIASEYRTWSGRTNAPNFEARTEAQRRVSQLAEAEVVLLGDRRHRAADPDRSTAETRTGERRPTYAPPVGQTPVGGTPVPETRQPAAFPANPPTPQNQPSPQWNRNVVSTNSLAVASLVSSLLWMCWAGSALGVLLGLIALTQISSSNGTQKGNGLAWTGVIIGAGSILFLFLIMAAASGGSSSRY